MPSFSDSIFLFVLALLLFGPKKLPELGKGIGEGFRALKDSMKEKPAEPSTAASAPATNSTETKV